MKLAIGYSDFKKIIDHKLDFVDKSLFIKEFLDDVNTEVSVITRPRRFGKTLNLSMLHCFLAAEVNGESTKGLFDNLKIASANNNSEGNSYISQQGQHPVIFVTLKNVKATSFSEAVEKLCSIIQTLYRENQYLLNSTTLTAVEKTTIQKYLTMPISKTEIENSILFLSEFLYKHHQQKKVYILIDEYDTPIQASYLNHYYNDMIKLMGGILGFVLKGNQYLNRAVVTGIVRVAKESLFSDLNNVKIYSLLHPKYSQYFGFIENEVVDLLKKAELEFRLEDVRKWFNGYKFAETIIYNPWSIVNFIQDKELAAYWVNTGSDNLIRNLILKSDSDFRLNLEKLLRGETCAQLIDEHVAFSDIANNPSAIWSLLVNTGYLKINSYQRTGDEEILCVLDVPNREIFTVYRKIIRNWLTAKRGIQWYSDFVNGLLGGEIRRVEEFLQMVLADILSVRDGTRESEEFYHALLLGLTVSCDLEAYTISSNREGSSYGYHDIMVIPKDENKLAVVIEVKSLTEIPKKESAIMAGLEKCANEAFLQIDKKNYVATVQARGVKQVFRIGIAFAGKRFKIKSSVGSSDRSVPSIRTTHTKKVSVKSKTKAKTKELPNKRTSALKTKKAKVAKTSVSAKRSKKQ